MHQSKRQRTHVPGLEFVTLVSDRTFPRHTHDEFGFGFLFQSGQESWSGRGHVEAARGDIITVNPGEVHDGIGCEGQPRGWHMVYLSQNAAKRMVGDAFDDLEFKEPVIARPEVKRALQRAVTSISTHVGNPDVLEEGLLSAFGAFKGCLLLQGAVPQISAGVENARTRIHDEYATSLSLSDLATTAGLSRFQLLRRFSKEIGATPHAYLTQQRVKSVKNLISAGMSLAEASLDCGFADQSHMTRAFVRQYGITPGQVRQSAQP